MTTAFKNIMEINPGLTLTTDASTTGWGQSVKDNTETEGLWSTEEQCSHISHLEMKAVPFGLLSLCSNLIAKHSRIQPDNTVRVS